MNANTRRSDPHPREAGFTLIEALVAIVVLIFGLMAVTNLLLVAASSNTVANQGTAATASATFVMDMLKSVAFRDTDPDPRNCPQPPPPNPPVPCPQSGRPILVEGGLAWGVEAGAPACDVALVADFHCTDSTPGVGRVHTHWWITADADLRLLHLRVRSEGTGALAGARSRAEFTSFRSCTNSDPTTGGCPGAP